MELCMKGLPFKATYYEVKADIAKVFHGEDSFFSTPDDRPLNFEIELNYVDEYYRRTDGTGVLVVPKPEIGDKLLKLLRNGRIQVEVQSRVVRIFPSKRVPSKSLVETLKRVPYQDPAVDQERDEKVEAVDKDFRVNSLQFGIWARRPTSANSRGLFCTEWDRSYTDIGNAVIRIDFDRKLIRITIGNAELDDEANHILLKFSNVKDMWAGYDYGNPFLCFDLLTPAIFECAWHTRESSGLIQEGSRKTLQRIGSLDSEHAQIAPYSHQIRLTLYQPEDLDEFVGLTTIAGLEYPGVRNGRRVQIDSEKHHYFTSKKLNQVEKLLKSIPFSVAFQVEALLRQGLVHTDNVLNDLWQPINDLYKDYPDLTAELLKIYVQELLAKRPPFTEAFKVLQALCSRKLQDGLKPESDHQNLMSCLHVTFTPTRMTLEGPYGVQSNRVIRKYVGYQDHFLRVDFRDEDRLQYRWDRQVDGETFLKERVGTILKEGFVLAGRRFEFLAYSSSSLRNHTVWFILPFHSEAHGYVCAAAIRKGLGGFDKIAHLPAKCAARIALAFTATDASVEVDQDRRRMIADIEDSTGRKFTDGVGTMSRVLNERIWAELCKGRPNRQETELLPSAYQIRYLGFKGVLVLDENLKDYDMCLRGSMLKFEGDALRPVVEIAQAFNKPKPMFLNRPLIMILEDRGIRKETFLELQNRAVSQTLLAYGSLEQLYTFMHTYSFCTAHKLAKTLRKLADTYNLHLDRTEPRRCLADPFLGSVAHTIVNSVLRDIKHRARIRVPDSWALVGVADEGVTYEKTPGYEGIFTLSQGEVYACIQEGPDDEPRYLKGQCIVSRSPTVHPGDVQLLWAVGKPPPDKPCFFRNLRNCIVFPCKGSRSLPSGLAGGDLDGDEYTISMYQKLYPARGSECADYKSAPVREINKEEVEDPQTGVVVLERLIPHICDFVVEYINSDVVGLVSTKHLIRADQSSEGVFDKGCLKMAELCSQAVDYPKNGVRVNTHDMPPHLIPYTPDWKEGEEDIPRRTDFYRSERALGYMFRKIAKENPTSTKPDSDVWEDAESYSFPTLKDHPVYMALHPSVAKALSSKAKSKENLQDRVQKLFKHYADELRYICQTHTLTDHPGVTLTEQEVVVGTILAQCSQHRWRTERIYRMRIHALNLVNEVRKGLMQKQGQLATLDESLAGLENAWEAWKFTVNSLASLASNGSNDSRFGLNSYGYIALEVVLDCLDKLE